MRFNRKWSTPKVSIQFRSKDTNGNYSFKSVKRKGPKPEPASGRYYLRFTDAEGKQKRTILEELTNYDMAVEEQEKLASILLCQFRGVELPASADPSADKTRISDAAKDFLAAHSALSKRTRAAYKLHLDTFEKSLPSGVVFVEQIDAKVVRHFQDWLLTDEGLSHKTVHNRLVTLADFLKHVGSSTKVTWAEAPKPKQKPHRSYEDEELEKLWAVMDAEEQAIFKFFLGTGGREQEVQHAEWSDINWQHQTFTIQAKEKWGFDVKNHLARTVKLSKELVAILKEHRKESDPKCSLLFPNTKCRPNGHFLRYLKAAAKRAGLNCGQCVSVIAGKEHSCADGPYCERYLLHHFRKTYATKLHRKGVPLNTIKDLLGHEDIKTTQIYLEGADVHSEQMAAVMDEVFSF